MEEKEFLEDGKTPNPKFVKKEENNGGNANGADDKNKGGEGDKTTFTKEEHQAELDRVAAKTRAEATAKAEKDKAEAIQKALENERENAKLSAEERAKKALEKDRADIEEQKKSIALRENLADVKVILGDLKYPPELAELLVNIDKDVQTANIAAFKAGVAKIVKDAIADATKGTPGKDVNTNGSGAGADGKPKTQF